MTEKRPPRRPDTPDRTDREPTLPEPPPAPPPWGPPARDAPVVIEPPRIQSPTPWPVPTGSDDG